MARQYARVKLSIWSDEDFRELSVAAQHLFLLLVSHPTLSLAGVGDWRPSRIAQLASGWSVEGVEAAAAELAQGLYVLFDLDTEEYLIRSFHRNDELLRSPNMGTAVAREAMQVSSSGLLGALCFELQRLRAEVPELKSWNSAPLQDFLERTPVDPASFPCWNPSVRVSGIPSSGVSVRVSGIPSSGVDQNLTNSVYESLESAFIPSVRVSAGGSPTTSNKQHTTRGEGKYVSTGADDTAPNPSPDFDSAVAVSPRLAAGGVDAESRQQQGPKLAPQGPPPGATPDSWSTHDDPRCWEHRELPRDQVPSCGACGQVRRWFEQQSWAEVEKHRREVRECPMCDDRGLVEVYTPSGTPQVVQCDHKTIPEQPKDTPAFQVASSAGARQAALRRFRKDATQPEAPF